MEQVEKSKKKQIDRDNHYHFDTLLHLFPLKKIHPN